MDYEIILGVLALILVFYIVYGFGGEEKDCGCGCGGSKKRIQKLMFWQQSPSSQSVTAPQTVPTKIELPAETNTSKFAAKRGRSTKKNVIIVPKPAVRISGGKPIRVPTRPAKAFAPVRLIKPKPIRVNPLVKAPQPTTNRYLSDIQKAINIKSKPKNRANKSSFDSGWLAMRGIGNIASTFEGGDAPIDNAHVDMLPADDKSTRGINPSLLPINRYYLQY